MTTAAHHVTSLRTKMQLHIDRGANRSVTPDKQLLLKYRNIKPYKISGINKDEIALLCKGVGYLPWQAPDGTTLLVKCYYSPTAVDTIISPSDVVLNHIMTFTSWMQHSDLTTCTGYIDFITHDNTRVHFPLVENNGLSILSPLTQTISL
jgi:hypothetical protein